MTTRKTLGTLALLMVVLLLAAGCGEKAPTQEPDDGAGLKDPTDRSGLIGAVLPLTGKQRPEAESFINGFIHAVKLKGKAVGLDATKGVIATRDYVDSPADILGLARDLMESEQSAVVLGPMDPAGVEVIEERARQRNAAVLTPISDEMKLGILGSTVRRLTFTDREEGAAMAKFALAKGAQTVVVIVDSDLPASEARAMAFADRFKELGGEVISQVAYAAGDDDFRRLVRMTAYNKPEMFYLTGARRESAAFVGEMKRQGIFGSVLGSTDWGASLPFPIAAGPGSSIYAPTRFHAGSGSLVTMEFVETFRKAVKLERDPNVLEALGYDAGLVVLDALSRSGNNRAKLADEIANVKGIRGVTGHLSARTWSLASEITVLKLKGSGFVFNVVVKIE